MGRYGEPDLGVGAYNPNIGFARSLGLCDTYYLSIKNPLQSGFFVAVILPIF
jgi:hypothetical protein